MSEEFTRQQKVYGWLIGAVILMVVVLIVILAGGCAARVKNVTALPAGATLSEVQAWDTEVAALHKVATVTSAVRQGVIQLNLQGALPAGSTAYIKALQTLAKVDLLEIEASDYLRGTPQTFGATQKAHIQTLLLQIGTLINSPDFQALAGIKNPKTQQTISELLGEFTVAFNLALQFAQ